MKYDQEVMGHKETVAKFNADKKHILMSTEEANLEAMKGKVYTELQLLIGISEHYYIILRQLSFLTWQVLSGKLKILFLKMKEDETSEGMYEDGICIAIVVDHRSTV